MVALFPTRQVVVQLGPAAVTWYGLSYVLAFVLAWRLLPRLQHYRGLQLSSSEWLTVVTAAAAGVLLGGRLGYVLLYEPAYFARHPGEILYLAGGGMSSHGGLVGAALGLWWVSRRLRVSYLALVDVAVVPAALGLALGRAANFINGELYVSPTGFAAAIAGNLLLAGMAGWHLQRPAEADHPERRGAGQTAGLWLVGYAALRLTTELLREQPFGHVAGLTRGQLYSLPLLVLGLLLWRRRR